MGKKHKEGEVRIRWNKDRFIGEVNISRKLIAVLLLLLLYLAAPEVLDALQWALQALGN